MGVSNDFNDISELVDSTIQNVKKLKEDKNIPAIQQNLNESQVKEQPNSKSSFFVYLNLPFILLANFFLINNLFNIGNIDNILEDLEFISQQLKESGSKLKGVYSKNPNGEDSLSSKMKEFDRFFEVCDQSLNEFTESTKKLLNINNLRNFQILG